MWWFSSSRPKDNDTKPKAATGGDSLKNWAADRYESVLVQRNLMFVLSVLCVVAIIVSTFFISKLTLQKTIQPMVIQIEESTGITDILNPLEDRRWTESRIVNEYFLFKYLQARETYNVTTYLENYNLTTRLLSSAPVYNQFKQYINDPSLSPIAKYGSINSTKIKIRSIQFMPDNANGKNVEIRFAVVEQQGNKKIYNKIASIVFNYAEMNMSFEDRMINPLGFQIYSYLVAGENNV